jgi:NAD(P)-dependent dehydrogenase (short-subunit alcohol dehydrogenase family)
LSDTNSSSYSDSSPESATGAAISCPGTCLITGATDGIGKALALALAQQGYRVILHGRNPDKLAAAVAEVGAVAGSEAVQSVTADFSSLEEVAALAEQVAREFPDLNVLVNNAGLLTDHRQQSKDGFELTFAVNYLAAYLLTRLLLATLSSNQPARVVNVASTAMGGGVIDFRDLQAEHQFDGWQAYANSKLANILFSHQLAGTLEGSGVVSNSLCPGLIDTNFFHTNKVFANGAYERMQPGMRTPEEGALVQLYLAADPAAAAVNGQFFIRDGRAGRRAVPLNWDRDTAAELWLRSEGLVKEWLPNGG